MGIVDKAKNSMEKAAGEVKEAVGKHMGDKDLEADGKKDQATGNLKDAGEKIKDVFKD